MEMDPPNINNLQGENRAGIGTEGWNIFITYR